VRPALPLAAPAERALPAADRTEIRALVDAYAVALDRLDVEGFVELWVPDALMEIHEDGPGAPATAEIRGRDRMHLPFPRLRTYLATVHVVGTHVAERTVGGAAGTTYCEAHHLVEGDGGVVADKVLLIRYLDDYGRLPEGWRLARRRVEVLVRWFAEPEVLR